MICAKNSYITFTQIRLLSIFYPTCFKSIMWNYMKLTDINHDPLDPIPQNVFPESRDIFSHGHSAGISVSKFNTDVIIFVLESSLRSGIFSCCISSVSFNMEYVLHPTLSSVTLTIFGRYRLCSFFDRILHTLCLMILIIKFYLSSQWKCFLCNLYSSEITSKVILWCPPNSHS